MISGLLVLLSISSCSSFLFDQTTLKHELQTNNQILTDSHYYALLGALAEERSARLKLENQQQQLEEFVKQLSQELSETKRMINQTGIPGEVGSTVNSTDTINNDLRKEIEHVKFMQKHLKDNIEDLNRTISSISLQTDIRNLSVYQRQIDNIQTALDHISLTMSNISNENIGSLSFQNVTDIIHENINIFESKFNDKLINKTVVINNMLNNVTKSLSDMESKLAADIVQADQKHSKNDQFMFAQIQELNQTVFSLSSRLTAKENQTTSSETSVALSACANGGDYLDGLLMTFVSNFSKGISTGHLQMFEQTGKFFVEKPGVYLFTTHISTYGTTIKCQLMKNNAVLTVVSESVAMVDMITRSASASSVIELGYNETLWIKADAKMNLVRSVNPYSCISIIKL